MCTTDSSKWLLTEKSYLIVDRADPLLEPPYLGKDGVSCCTPKLLAVYLLELSPMTLFGTGRHLVSYSANGELDRSECTDGEVCRSICLLDIIYLQ